MTIYKKVNKLLLSALILVSVWITGRTNMQAEQKTYNKLEDIPVEKLESLSKYTIYFGHQSVGYNIIEGIEDIMRENKHIELSIVETTSWQDEESHIFAHSRVGKNRYPLSKIDSFTNNIQKGFGDNADIAFVKLCYVDTYKDTDIVEIFDHYSASLNVLKKQYPDTVFVHLTMPIMIQEKGMKSTMKRMLGKHVMGYEDNLRRQEYNMMIRSEYGGREPLFDIALIESTHRDGTREEYEQDGVKYYALVPEYTSDGGHLNEVGRRIVAEQLLIFLANLTD